MSVTSIELIGHCFDDIVALWKHNYPTDVFLAQLEGNPGLFEGVLTRRTYVDYFIQQADAKAFVLDEESLVELDKVKFDYAQACVLFDEEQLQASEKVPA